MAKKDGDEGLFIPARWVWMVAIFIITTGVPTIANMFVSSSIVPINNKLDSITTNLGVINSEIKSLDKQLDDVRDRVTRLEAAIASSK